MAVFNGVCGNEIHIFSSVWEDVSSQTHDKVGSIFRMEGNVVERKTS